MVKTVLFVVASSLLVSCAGIQSRYHEVAAGQSLAQIASQYQIPVEELKKYNRVAADAGVRPGTKLYLPFEESATWNAQFSQVATNSREVAAGEATAASYDVSRVHFSWPLFGYVSSLFGRRHNREHEGIDIPAKKGTPVRAARSGHVIYASNKISGYGNMVIVRHADHYSTVYAHLAKFDVKRGQFVSRGQRVGRVGVTGHTTGPHLHFEIRENRVPVNPLLFLQGQYAHNIAGR